MSATTPFSGRILVKPAELINQFPHLQVAPGTNDTSKDGTFGVLISNFDLVMHLLLVRMVAEYAVAAPVVIADVPLEHACCTLPEDVNLANPLSTTVTDHYKQGTGNCK